MTPRRADQDPSPESPKKKRRQTPYKPRLANVVKAAMEETVDDAIEAQKLMTEILTWLDQERSRAQEIRGRLETMSLLDHRMHDLRNELLEGLLRMGKFENRVAQLALRITAIERRMQHTIIYSRSAVPPPRERRGNDPHQLGQN